HFLAQLWSQLVARRDRHFVLNSRVIRQHYVPMRAVAKKPNARGVLALDNLYDAAFRTAIRFSSLDTRQHPIAMHRVRHGIAADEEITFDAGNRLIGHQETVSIAVRHDSSGNQIRIDASTSRASPIS